MMSNKNVVVLGASGKPDKYSYKAVIMLAKHGYNVYPVHPSGIKVAEFRTCRSLNEITEIIHTLTVYVSAKISNNLKDEILAMAPERIIFNPGAENQELAEECEAAGIEAEEACTLVLLQTSSF